MDVITKWGELELIIYENTYKFASAGANITEIPVLPSPNSLERSSVLQQGGRSRKRITFSGAVIDRNHYNSLLDDHLTCEERTFIGYDNEEFNAIIEYLSPPIWKESFWEYSMVLVEV